MGSTAACAASRAISRERGVGRRCHHCHSTKRAAVSALLFLSILVLFETTPIHNNGGGGGSRSGGMFVSGFLHPPVPRSKKCCSRPPNAALTETGRHPLGASVLFLRPDDTNANENETPSDSAFETAAAAAAITTGSDATRSAPSSSFQTATSVSTTPRRIRIERMPRLPVWPVWAGVIDFFVGWIVGPEAGSKLEQYFLGGRVCPMQLDGTSTSPFLLLVHHHHNFWKWDAIFRKLSALVLPEGFPAHPHRGFTTLTYFLPDSKDNNNKRGSEGGGGGFVHRDSIGVKQTYGTKGSYKHQAQWLFTGSGMLHEEMFDFLQDDFPGKDYNSRYELYQLWVNVPGQHKLDPPEVQLLRTGNSDGDGEERSGKEERGFGDGEGTMPEVSTTRTIGTTTTTCDVVVIAGSYQPHDTTDYSTSGNANDNDNAVHRSQVAPLHSDLSVLHVTITDTEASKASEEGSSASQAAGWTYDIPPDHDTLIVYVRKGACTMQTVTGSKSDVSSSGATEVPIHSTVFVEKTDRRSVHEQLVVRPSTPDDPVDLLVLSGRPLYEPSNSGRVEPVAMQGSMVMNDEFQIQEAYRDYQQGQMGVPWDHELNDEEWREHVRRTTIPRGRQ